MRNKPARLATLALAAVFATHMGALCPTGAKHEAQGQQTFASPHANPLALSGGLLFVAATTSGVVDVINTATNTRIERITVGMEPVGVAVRPGADEVWVSNHLSDSVSVIDTNPASNTYLSVIETVQDIDSNGATQFDEPVGIAFNGAGTKAYVALSSRNDIAVVDTSNYTVTSRIHITAQEPRALAVNGNFLYVPAFESFNQTELALCPDPENQDPTPGQCTLDGNDLIEFVVESPNIPGAETRIATDPDAPDRDVFVIDMTTDQVVQSVSGVGTLLYGVAAGSNGSVFVTQTEARNDANPEDSDRLIDIENRLFLNQIAELDCSGGTCSLDTIHELEPLLPSNPALSDALATPYGIAISDDNSTLLVTAMGTSRLFSFDISTGQVLDILDLNDGDILTAGQQIPRGVTLLSDGPGAPQTAYVHNTLENTVSVVSVAGQSGVLTATAKFFVGNDPTPDNIRLGRIAFMNAFASTTGTFSCESCHPDGNTDQLLWRIGGECEFCGGSRGDEVRSTMPVRGLRNTLPLHWDGSLGDPFGGGNGAVGFGGNGGTDCSLASGDQECFEDLVAASLSGVMCTQNQQGQTFSCNNTGPSGNPGALTSAERSDMATFLANVSYPPPRSRTIDDVVTPTANDGFGDFFITQLSSVGGVQGVETCADMDSGCHDLPLGVTTNSSTLGGFDAPTMRGMTDRTLQFSMGITNAEEVLEFAVNAPPITIPGFPTFNPPPAEFPWDPVEGYEERTTYSAAFIIFRPVYQALASTTFQMFEEASTGYSGAVARQVTLNQTTTNPSSNLADTQVLVDALELADQRGLINLRAVGKRDRGDGVWKDLDLSYGNAGNYSSNGNTITLTPAQMISGAQAGTHVVTLTGRLRANVGTVASPMPLLSVPITGFGGTGNPALPLMTSNFPLDLLGIDVESGADVFINGAPDSTATVTCLNGITAGRCDPPTPPNANVRIQLTSRPSPNGLYLIQVLNSGGLLSNEFPVCVSGGGLGACR